MHNQQLAALLGVVFLSLAAFHFLSPIPVAPEGMTRFSAQSVQKHIEAMAAEPHFMGSEANAKVRDYIVEEFSKIGLKATVEGHYLQHRRWGRSYANLARPENIIVMLKGKNTGKAVLVMGHYDSVLNSPGAGDDVHTVANILEVARLLKEETLENDVIFLITDGEELGLFGALAYVENHDLSNIGVLLNYEARGNSGPSISFEWSNGNAWLVRQLRKAGRRPVANSLSYEIYDRMPNGSDFTHFKEAGVPGINNAFIGGFSYYHSPDDRPEKLNLRSVQHAGENMYLLTKHLASTDLSNVKSHNASFFNLFGVLVIYSSRLDLPIAILTLALWLVLTVRWLRSGKTSLKKVSLAFLVHLGLLALIFGLAKGLGNLILALYPDYNVFYAGQFYNHEWYLAAAAGLALLVVWLMISRLKNRLGIHSLQLAYLTILSFFLVAVHYFIPTATYLMAVPMVGLFTGLFIRETGPVVHHSWADFAVGLFMMILPCALWITTVHLLFLAFSLSLLAGPVVLFSVFALALLLAFEGLWEKKSYALPVLAVVGFTISFGWAHLTSKPTAERPLLSNLYHVYDADAETGYWVTNNPSANIGNQAAITAPERIDLRMPWLTTRTAQFSGIETKDLAPVIRRDSTRRQLEIRYPQRILWSTLHFEEMQNIKELTLNDQRITSMDSLESGAFTLNLYGMGLDSLTIKFSKRDTLGPVNCYLGLSFPGLPVEDDLPPNAVRTGGYTYVTKRLTF